MPAAEFRIGTAIHRDTQMPLHFLVLRYIKLLIHAILDKKALGLSPRCCCALYDALITRYPERLTTRGDTASRTHKLNKNDMFEEQE